MPRKKKKAGAAPPRAPAASQPAAAASEATPLLLARPSPILEHHNEDGHDDIDIDVDDDGPPVVSWTTPYAAGAGASSSSVSACYEEERRYARRTLVVRHLFSSLLARVWDFAIVLLLTVVGPRASFALIASYGITVNVTVACLSPPVGKLIDRSDRLRAVVGVTAAQNACTVLSGGCFLLLLYAGIAPASWAWHALVVAVHVFGGINNLFYGLGNIIIERDWVVVIAQEDDAWLRTITSNLKSIDLSCDLVAPMLVSFLQFFSYGALTAAICAGNVCMIYLQYAALHEIYHRVPELSKAPILLAPAAADDGGGHDRRQEAQENGRQHRRASAFLAPLREFGSHLKVYASQRSFLPGLSLAMLYLTVLSFHMTMLSYLMMRGLSVVLIGVLSGAGSALGILGTLSYKCLAARIGTTRTGLLALWSQVTFLTIAVLALYSPTTTTTQPPNNGGIDADGTPLPPPEGFRDVGLAVFVGAVALSRFGLFMYDVAGAQLFQYLVDEQQRAVVGGVQRTLESIFELGSFLLVLVYPRPEQFPTLSALSYLMVLAAAVVFSSFACRESVGTLQEEHTSHRPVEVRAISPIINKFERLSTILSEGSSLPDDDDGGENGTRGEGKF